MNRRRNFVWTPRLTVAGFVIVLASAVVASWASLPARAGSGAAAQSVLAPVSPQHMYAVRTGIVYPLELPPAAPSVAQHSRRLRAYSRGRRAAMNGVSSLPEVPPIATLALTTSATLSTSFIGLAFPASQCGPGCEPPDTQVAAGPDYVVEVVNVVGQIFDKSGNAVGPPFNLNQMFGVDPSIFSSDPRIEYDTLSDRWFISFLILDNAEIAASKTGYFALAVSKTSDPTAGFFAYRIETPGDFPDQPSLGFNDDKVATGGNSFSCDPDCLDGPYEGNEFLVWNKSELLAGDATIDTNFFPALPNGQDSSQFPIIPAKSRSSTSTLFMVSAFANELNFWEVTGIPGVDGGSLAMNTMLPIVSIDVPPVAPQKGSSTHPIDTSDARLLDAVFRDGHLWTSAGASCKPLGDSLMRSCLQYVEVLTGGATPKVNQDFTFGTKGFYDYYPSVDLDSSDDLISSFSQSSAAEYPSVYVDGRQPGDAPDSLESPVLVKSGVAPYTSTHPDPANSNAYPWGDYSGAGVDPADQTGFWVAGEYTPSGSTPNWGTWIANARLIPAPSPTATATATATPTATATATATATPTTSATPTVSATPTASDTPTASASGTPTASDTPTPTDTATSTATATATATATSTPTATVTATATPTATPTPVGTLSVSTSQLNFGTLKVGKSKKKNVKIKNTGKFPLQVTVGGLASPFTVAAGSGPFTLSKGKKKTVKVLFKPTGTGATPDQILSIISNDSNHLSQPVTVTGSGK